MFKRGPVFCHVLSFDLKPLFSKVNCHFITQPFRPFSDHLHNDPQVFRFTFCKSRSSKSQKHPKSHRIWQPLKRSPRLSLWVNQESTFWPSPVCFEQNWNLQMPCFCVLLSHPLSQEQCLSAPSLRRNLTIFHNVGKSSSVTFTLQIGKFVLACSCHKLIQKCFKCLLQLCLLPFPFLLLIFTHKATGSAHSSTVPLQRNTFLPVALNLFSFFFFLTNVTHFLVLN